MLKEIETEHGSIVLDAGWEDAVDHLWDLVDAEERLKVFDKEIRGKVRSVAYEILRRAVLEYDLDEPIMDCDYFWEWYAEQQED